MSTPPPDSGDILAPAGSRGQIWWKLAAVALVAFIGAAAFSAYLRPGMLLEFANLVLCS